MRGTINKNSSNLIQKITIFCERQ
jgi:hypothetical protein